MIAQPITKNKLKEAIRVAYDGDHDIFKFYDSGVKVETVDDIVNDIARKIDEYGEMVVSKGIYEKQQLIGYLTYKNRILISFSVNTSYRTRSYLREFYKLIKREIGSSFMCELWSKNQRAIKYLIKNRARIVREGIITTQLFCP